MKKTVTICIGLLLASGIVGARIADPAKRMKSATIRFSQIEYYSTGDLFPVETPAEQFDEWRHSEKRDILAISLGEEKLWSRVNLTGMVIGKFSYIDILYQIPEEDWWGEAEEY